MKKIIIFIILFSPVLLTSYDPVFDYAPDNFKPILLERSILENSVKYEAPQTVKKPGKIYSYKKYILLNEKYKGIHVFDNSSPESPQNIGFIRIPGCIDMAVKDSVLYADNAVDLIAVDITNIKSPKVVKRIVEVFPELKPPGQDWIPYAYAKESRPEKTVIIEWIEE